MSDNMNEQYQQVLTGTLTDTIMKSISLQANIKLANDIIAEQEKTIQSLKDTEDTSKKELKGTIESLKTELDSVKSNKTTTENGRITMLENAVKAHLATIASLQNNVNELNKLKSDYENVKHQVQHVDTFRNELVKEREAHQKTRDEFSGKIEELNSQIEYLQLTPAKRKKIDEAKKVVEEPSEVFATSEQNDIVKDGGSF
jgi:chromosome segregation ATPase